MTILRLHIDHEGNQSTLVFEKFPVRIGRDEVNECRLEFAFVSRSHCLLELREGALFLRDEGSRQGTWSRRGEERLRPMALHDLGALGYEFQIGALHFRAELCERTRTEIMAPAVERFSAGTVDLGAGVGPAVAFGRIAHPAVKEQAPAPAGDSRDALLQRTLEQYGQVCALLSKLLREAVTRDPARGPRLADAIQREGLPLRMFEDSSVRDARAAAQVVEAVALERLRDLAGHFAPQVKPLASASDIGTFTARLGAVLGTLMEGIAALRLAHQHESGATPTDPSRALLSEHLLDWTADRSAIDSVRGELREMLAFHNRLVGDIDLAWDDLLAVLDPDVIERTCAANQWSPFRYRALWSEFGRRYGLVRERRRRPQGPTYDRVVRALGGRSSQLPPSAGRREPGALRYGAVGA